MRTAIPTIRRRVAALCCAAAVTLALTSCGSDDHDSNG